ncbi:DUF2993 domain-containing protein [Kineococcus sp. LSe6-4]|uniref:DUF2993 domain-containing protein n=1 Tax=Kineococcus halophytocola TaxID=3234027 RepID=A0ABV4H1D0_9ACTN
MPRRSDSSRPVRVLVPTLVTLLALALIAVAADLAARAWATDRVAAQLRTEYGLAQDPQVDVAGGSFLWQAARGRFEDVTVTVDELTTEDDLLVRDLRVRLPAVDVPRSVLTGGAGTVDVAGGTVRAEVAYSDLAQRASVGGLDVTLRRDGDAVRAGTTVRVFGLGVDLGLTGRPVLEGSDVRLEPVRAEVAGASVPLRRADQLLAAAGFDGFSFPLEGLPPQVRLDAISVADDGLVVTGTVTPSAVRVG